MSHLYFNSANMNIADMAYLDFGIQLNGNTTSTAKLVTTYDGLKHMYEHLGKLIFEVDTKLAEAAKSKN